MISLIIPCFNEKQSLPTLVEKCKNLAKEVQCEIILVDNGSTDGSYELMVELTENSSQLQPLRLDLNQGYGNGILSGLEKAKGEILGWTHADLQTDPRDVILGLEFFNGTDGDVFVKGRRSGRPLMDVCFTVCMTIFEAFLLKKFMPDINAQPTLFTREFFTQLKNPPKDFSLDLFVFYQAKRQKIKVRRFPVKFGKRMFGVSHWNVDWKSKWKFIKRTIYYSIELKGRMN